MRRVVVTGMGIVSSIGNSTQEVLASLREAKSGIVARREICRARLPLPGARRADARSGRRGRSSRHAVPRRRRRLESRRHGAGDPRRRARASEISHERTGIIMGSGGPSTRAIVEAADTARSKGPKRVGPFAVPKAMSSTASATLAHLVQDQGRQLFDLVGLRDLEPLHRQCHGDHPARQAGHDLRRRLRGARLDALGAVRRHGGDVVEVQRDAGRRPRAPTTSTATVS